MSQIYWSMNKIKVFNILLKMKKSLFLSFQQLVIT